MRLDAELQRMLWKINWEELVFTDVTKSIGSSRGSLVGCRLYGWVVYEGHSV